MRRAPMNSAIGRAAMAGTWLTHIDQDAVSGALRRYRAYGKGREICPSGPQVWAGQQTAISSHEDPIPALKGDAVCVIKGRATSRVGHVHPCAASVGAEPDTTVIPLAVRVSVLLSSGNHHLRVQRDRKRKGHVLHPERRESINVLPGFP